MFVLWTLPRDSGHAVPLLERLTEDEPLDICSLGFAQELALCE